MSEPTEYVAVPPFHWQLVLDILESEGYPASVAQLRDQAVKLERRTLYTEYCNELGEAILCWVDVK